MVALSSKGPNSEALLRYASRLAGRLNRNWYAVYVQTPGEHPAVIDAATQRQLANALTLAQQLGATVFTYKGDDTVKTILQFAREYRVGHIVIGAPGKKVPFWRRLCGEASIAERLIAEGRGITIVVHDAKLATDEHPGAGSPRPPEHPPSGAAAMKPGQAAMPDAMVSEANILVWKTPMEKAAAMRQLLDACCREEGAPLKESAWQALLERERQGETFVGEDVAIPHARIGGLAQPLVALGIGKASLRDRDAGPEARIMFLLLSPAETSEIHVKMLGRIGRMASDDHWRREVLAAKAPAEVWEIILKWEERQPGVAGINRQQLE
jgi:two-component system sensor histidine kinase KdpD